jgi:CHAT domain-containing protein
VSDTDIVVRQKIQQASLIFMGTPPKDKILQSLESLESCMDWTQKNSIITLENEALWGIYLCYSRLDRYSDAADTLIRLRKNLEAIRRGIKNPQERGGVFANHPHLFGALCEYLYKANRPADLLEAIEASKGRAIADRLTEQAGAAVDDAAIYERVRLLPELASKEAFHYLTYFVEDTAIYAVLVTKHGDVRMLDPIPIPRRDLQHLAENVDPRRWGKPQRDSDATLIESLQVALAPLVAWFDHLVETAVLNEDDHICYSTDDALHNVPLHYLCFREALLINWFSLSRVHSAFHLDHLLAKPTSRAPDRYVGAAVGLLDEQVNAAFVESLQAPLRWLQDHEREGHALIGAEATLARITQEALNDRIVHFSVHGMFPQGLKSPFDDSYLLLADDQGLPMDSRRGGKLSPSAIFAAGLDFSGSHVSVMACISGLARKGVAGDALGLDWAFIQAGAISLISTHWDVNASAAARFFICYYEHWIVHECSRAEAHRAAMLELLADDRSNLALNKWGAFSLTGDFR